MKLNRMSLPAAALGVVALSLTMAAKPVTDARPTSRLSLTPSCAEVKAWVATNLGKLPTTLTELNKLPVAYRKGAVGALTVERQRALWHEHLSIVLATDRDLSPTQRQFIETVDKALPRYINGEQGRKQLTQDSVSAKARKLFGLEHGKRIFVLLGNPDAPAATINHASLVSGAAVNALIAKVTKVLGVKQPTPNCNCSTGSDWCGGSNHCQSGGCTTDSGCGTLWQQQCNGMCYQNT